MPHFENSTRHSNSNNKNMQSQRSNTPKQKNLYFGMNTRESKSMSKAPISSTTFIPVSNNQVPLSKLMQPINEYSENNKYYYLGKGNNHEVIKRMLNLRKNLVETTNSSDFLHFKWTQNSFGFKYHTIGKECLVFNHFQFHKEISNKQRLVWNMISYCEANKLNAFTFLPVTYIIDLTTGEEDLALHGFLKFYNRNVPEKYSGPKVHSIVLPRTKYMPYLSPQQLRKKSQGNFYCKPNCPKSFFCESGAYLWILKPTFMNRGRGVSLFSNLQEFQKLIWKYYEGEGLEDYQNKQGLGEQFKLEEGGNTVRIFTTPDQDFNEEDEKEPKEEREENQIEEINQKLIKKNNLLISQKKIQNKIQSKIKIQQKIKENKIEEKIIEKNQKLQASNNTNAYSSNQNSSPIKTSNAIGSNLRVLSFVVQKYIECPMLINERKFDIRVWALVTQNYQVYFFREGYLRFSSHKYSTNNHNNPFIHLTNNSVQKHCNEYDENSGNQISLSEMQRYIPNETVYAKIQTKIRDIIWLSMSSVRRKINVNGRKECFEVFGYDFMIDNAFKVWLIEVNTNPAIEECSSILKLLIPRMIDDMFQLTLDKLLNLSYKENKEIFQVPGFSNQENMWELLGDFKEGANQKTMGKRLTFLKR